jgi:LPXTG-motif cell wall-anchored protein
MYGSVLGASVTAGSVAVLPNTGGSKLSMAITLGCLTIGVAITVITVTRTLAARIFNA